MKNYYEILNISFNSSKTEIKKAYRILAVKYHPDKNNGNEELTKKFLEVKEAYDTLINSETRKNYDVNFHSYFDTASTENKSKNNTTENTNSDFTPQYSPSFNLFGKKLSPELIFFKLPKQIGIIIGAHSDLKKGEKPLTKEQKKSNTMIWSCIGLIIYLLIFFIGKPNTFWTFTWFVIVSLCSWLFISGANEFLRTNLFVGTKGFAKFEMKESKENIVKEFEINFKNITDLYVIFTDVKENFEYVKTKYEYIFFNEKEKVFSANGEYNKKEKQDNNIELNFLKLIEKSYTIFLLDNIEKELAEKGHILFKLNNYSLKDYIKMGIGEITFVKDQQEFTYKYDDIKSVYTRSNYLYIEHSNFERKLYFFKSGNADKIPLLDLCNREFFFKAFEILLGYNLD